MSILKKIQRVVSCALTAVMLITSVPAQAIENGNTKESEFSSSIAEELKANNGTLTVKSKIVSNAGQAPIITTNRGKQVATWMGQYKTPKNHTGFSYCGDHTKAAPGNSWMNVTISGSNSKNNDAILVNTFFFGSTDDSRNAAYFKKDIWPLVKEKWHEITNYAGDATIQTLSDDGWRKATQMAIWMAMKTPGGKPMLGAQGSKAFKGGKFTEGPYKNAVEWIEYAKNSQSEKQRAVYAATLALHFYATYLADTGTKLSDRVPGGSGKVLEQSDLQEFLQNPSFVDFSSASDNPQEAGNIKDAYGKIPEQGIYKQTYKGKEYFVTYWTFLSKTQPSHKAKVTLEGKFPEGTVVAPIWTVEGANDKDTLAKYGITPETAKNTFNSNSLPAGNPLYDVSMLDSFKEGSAGVTSEDLGAEKVAYVLTCKLMIPVDSVKENETADFTMKLEAPVRAYNCYLGSNSNSSWQPFILGDLGGKLDSKVRVRWDKRDNPPAPEPPEPEPPEPPGPGPGPGGGPPQSVLSKIDAVTGVGLQDAVFNFKGIDKDNGNINADFKTDAAGNLLIQWWNPADANYAPPGHYEVRETKAPEGYNVDTESVRYIELIFDGKTATHSGPLIFKNSKKPYISIVKVDENGQYLEGVTFSVWKDGKPIGNIGPTIGGPLEFRGFDDTGLENGYYEFQELQVPEGYVKSPEKKGIHVDVDSMHAAHPDGAIAKITFVNTKTPSIIIQKRSPDGTPLANAHFDVTIDGHKLTDRVTDDAGIIQITEAEYGDFLNEDRDSWTVTVTETQPPPGYLMSPERTKTKEVKKGVKVVEFEFVNDKYPQIVIKKVDKEHPEKPVPGAKFDIEIDGQKVVGGPFVADEQGLVTLSYDKYKDYLSNRDNPDQTWGITVTEVSAPPDYNRDEVNGGGHTLTGTLHLGTESFELTFSNTHYRDIHVTKVDAENDWKLGGARFKLHCVSVADPAVQKPADRFATTEEGTGIATFENVPNGVYELTEVTAPAGYEPSKEVKRITVTSDSPRVIEMVVENTPQTGLVIRKVDAVSKQAVPGCTFDIVGHTYEGETVTFKDRISDANGLVILENLKAGQYIITETAVPDGYILDSVPRTVELKKEHQSVYYEFKNNSKSALYILKLSSATGLPVPGVRFSVSTAGGKHIADVTTGENGYARLTGLQPGGYVVKEIWCPPDMILDPTPQTIEISADDSGKIYELVFYNNEKTNLVLQKIDAKTREPLEGAYFTIRKGTGEEVAVKQRTDEQGLVLLKNLDPGVYVVEEIAAPNGYILTSGEQRVVLEANKTKQIILENRKKTGVMLKKVDADTGLPVGGATFELWSIDDHLIGSYPDSDKDGIIHIPDLEPGQYIVKEIKAPDGYILNSEPKKITVKDSEATEIVIENKSKVMLTISKVDAETGVPLAGAEFNIATLDGQIVKNGVTDETGKLQIRGLEPGWYNVLEIKAPNGYILNDKPYQVELVSGQDASVEIPNTGKKGLWLEKLDAETDAPLAGAVFEIYSMEGKFIGEYTTNASGTINTDELSVGHYKVREKKAPEGYLLDPSWQYFEMVEGQKTKITFRDWKKTVIRIEKYDKVTSKPLAGAVFEVRTADGKTVIGTYTTDVNGATYSPAVNPGAYVVEEIKAPEGYVLNKEIKPVNVESGHMPEVVRFYNEPKEMTIIKKVDAETGKPLAGATFRLFDQQGDPIGEYQTGADGIVLLPELAPGTYSIQEIFAPKGYMIDKACKKVFEVKPGQHASLTFKDTKKPGIQIIKVDAKTGDPLAGATIELKNSSNKVIDVRTTDEDGTLIFTGLAPDVYTITETKAPKGYVLDTESKTIKVEAGDTQIVTFKNTKNSALNVKKTDPEGNPLAGAVFTVTRNSDKKVIGRYTTDATGCLAVENLEPGDYTVTEIIAPEGYVLTTESKVVTITKGEPSYVAFINERLMGIEITKLDASNDKPLAGAVFEVRDNNNVLIGTYTTKENGQVNTDVLKPGRYTVKETKAPEGYKLDQNQTQTVEVKTGEVAKVIFRNDPEGALRIVKVDKETNDPLAGAVFEVFPSTDPECSLGKFTTNEAGEVFVSGLKKGSYIVNEIKAPDGYKISDDAQKIVRINGASAEIVFVNEKMPGLTINKIDSETKQPLAGASFTVTNTATGDVVFTGTTDSTGLLQTDVSAAGTYTITETKAPNGYKLNDKPETVTLTGNKTTSVTIANTPLAKMTIKKVSALSKEPLAGASFEVRAIDGSVVRSVTTDASGLAFVSGLTEGGYQITETKAPDGYILNKDHIDFYVSAGNDNVLTVENYMNAGLVIRKADKFTGDLLQGAKFSVESSDGNIAYTGTTDASGIIMTGPLDPGTYIVREISAPAGYLKDSEPQMVELKENQTRTVEFKDSPMTSIMIEKVDSLTGETLQGARFKLTNIGTNKVISEGVTGVDGLYLVSDLTPGRYLVEELIAPDGYIKETEPIIADVEIGKVAHVTFKNAPMAGIVIDSIDVDTKKPLDGSTFQIWEQNGEMVSELTTDSTGRVQTLTLKPGYYVIKQTVVKDGYTVLTQDQTVEVKSGKQQVHVTFEAQGGYTLKIENVNENDRDVMIQKSEFEVTKIDGSLVGKYTTDINGQIIVPDLAAGWYLVKNIRPGEGYALNEEVFRIEVKAGTIATVVVRSKPLTGLTINVLDSESKNPISGAKFEIYRQNGELINSFTSDSTGHIETLPLPEGYYVIKQVKAPDGYLPAEDQTVHLTTASGVTVTIYNVAKTVMQVMSVDKEGKGIAGMKIQVTRLDGSIVGDYTTDKTGLATIDGVVPGWYIVTEISAPEGYTVNTESQRIEVKSNTVAKVTFTHNQIYGLRILTVVGDTKTPLAGATYSIEKLSGERVGTYASDAKGIIYVTLKPDTYVVKQTALPNGYPVDSNPQNVTVGTDKITELTYTVGQLSSMRILIKDSATGKGIYGMKFLLKDVSGAIVGEFTTNDQGYIMLDRVLQSGTYTLELISAPGGYSIDKTPRTIQVLSGETTEVNWSFSTDAGQVQIVVRSSDYNKMLDRPAESLLPGAVFEIYNPDNFAVMDTIISGTDGVAASSPLPIGRYIIRQKSGAPYYAANDKEMEVRLKVPNDVVRVEYYNRSANISLANDIRSNKNVSAGSFMRVDFTAVNNASDTRLDDFFWHVKIPTDCARAGTFYTGSWNTRANYSVFYKTNMNDYRKMGATLVSTNQSNLDLSSTALGLLTGEYVTDIMVKFGTVPSNFVTKSAPALYLYVSPSMPNGYKCIMRSEIGGKMGNEWLTANSTWTTNVLKSSNLPDRLPKTGF